jgi:myo-inositol-1(or 4)-monophosphatase
MVECSVDPFRIGEQNVMTHYLDAAVEAARAAGEMLRHNFGSPPGEFLGGARYQARDRRSRPDLITEMLLKQFPEHALYGEEGIVGDQTSDHQWVSRSLDGTVNFSMASRTFACRSRCDTGEIIVGVIYDPIRDELWNAQKGEKPTLNGRPFRVSERARFA